MKPSGGGGGETSGESLTLCSNSVKNVVSQAKQSKAKPLQMNMLQHLCLYLRGNTATAYTHTCMYKQTLRARIEGQ